MNIDNIKELIKVLKETETYDQKEWFHPCGSPACIAGHAFILEKSNKNTPYYNSISYHDGREEYLDAWNNPVEVHTMAQEYLDITDEQTSILFFGYPFYCEYGDESDDYEPTTEDAIATLEYLIKTGEVLWLKG